MRSIIAVCAAALALGTAGAAVAHGGGGDDPSGHEARHHNGVGRHHEVRGRIASFTDGVLTVRTRRGDLVRGRVTASTRIECGASRDDDACDANALTPGRAVREAKLRSAGGRARFLTVELR